MSAGHNAEALRKTSNGLIRILAIQAEQKPGGQTFIFPPHMGSLLSFVIKSLVLGPREIKSAKRPWGSPSSEGDCASLALLSLIPSFPSQHLIFSWLLQSHPCPSCLCLAPRVGKAMDILGELLLCAQEIPQGFFFFLLQLKKIILLATQ